MRKLNSCADSLFSWGKELALRFRKDIDNCKTELELVRFKTDEASIRYFKELKIQLSHRLDQEAAYWRQRSKFYWLKDGDSNTRFFHATASGRKKKNEIAGLTTDKGEWVQTDEDIQRVVTDYFHDLYSNSHCKYDEVLDCVDVRIKSEENTALLIPFSKEEFKEAIMQMHPDKSPGPDGFNLAFYQRFWDLVDDDVYRDSLEWMNNLCFPPSVNHTNICLIPKHQNSRNMKDYRPIALCNVNYKILAKVLANRLKKLLPRIISQEQSAFVSGRSITDNVLVAFEIIHYMKRKNKGKQGDVAYKINISKAYDKIDWGFLRGIMLKFGFDNRWVDLMMLCVSTVRYNVLVNGREVGPIIPKRGLWQGDPLSPYLFILCAEGLSSLIKRAESEGVLHGC